MLSFSSTRSRSSFGRGAGAWLLLASLACAAVACKDDDDPAEQTGAAGSLNAPDASVRPLPGEGLEPTPDFDTDTRQREPVGPDELNDSIDEIRNNIGGNTGGSTQEAPDAGVIDAGADAGAP